ncbi:hypothetical protein ACTXT7_008203 [Hymenolepis weldensis]
MAATSAIGESNLEASPLPLSSLSSSSSAASNQGDVDQCEGYLIVSFNKSTDRPTPQPASQASLASTTPLSVNPSISPSNRPPRISRLAALANGYDVSQFQQQHSLSNASSASSNVSTIPSISCSPLSSIEYVRRFTYPDGDTHYDWLSCPLAEMQAKGLQGLSSGTNSTSTLSSKPISLAPSVPRKSFLVYDSSLPSVNLPTPSSSYRRQLTTSRKMLRCEECGKYYGNEYSLHHHICLRRKDVWKKGDVPTQVVDGQLTYFCPVCNKPFKWLGNLTRHYYVHTGQRFFKCDICHKEFFSAYQVRRHMNSHTGLRFQCSVCEKPFTCKYACAWHARQHVKETQQLQQTRKN